MLNVLDSFGNYRWRRYWTSSRMSVGSTLKRNDGDDVWYLVLLLVLRTLRFWRFSLFGNRDIVSERSPTIVDCTSCNWQLMHLGIYLALRVLLTYEWNSRWSTCLHRWERVCLFWRHINYSRHLMFVSQNSRSTKI